MSFKKTANGYQPRGTKRSPFVEVGDLVKVDGIDEVLSVIEVMLSGIAYDKPAIVACKIHHNKPLVRVTRYRGFDWVKVA